MPGGILSLLPAPGVIACKFLKRLIPSLLVCKIGQHYLPQGATVRTQSERDNTGGAAPAPGM